MPASVMKAVPAGRIWGSAVGTWLCVPTPDWRGGRRRKAYALLFRWSLAMEIDHEGNPLPRAAGSLEFAVDRCERIVDAS